MKTRRISYAEREHANFYYDGNVNIIIIMTRYKTGTCSTSLFAYHIEIVHTICLTFKSLCRGVRVMTTRTRAEEKSVLYCCYGDDVPQTDAYLLDFNLTVPRRTEDFIECWQLRYAMVCISIEAIHFIIAYNFANGK